MCVEDKDKETSCGCEALDGHACVWRSSKSYASIVGHALIEQYHESRTYMYMLI
jgi:hypothetical protein